MYYINYVGFATHSQLFWELCWELFLVNRPNLHLHLVNSLAKCTLTKKNLVNRLSVNTQSSAFSEGWPKVHSVNSKFGQSGTDERNVLYKSLPVTGFEPQTHGIGSATLPIEPQPLPILFVYFRSFHIVQFVTDQAQDFFDTQDCLNALGDS